MIKTCKQCQSEFEVTEDDLSFYKKISPTFSGMTFEIPSPSLCPQCRIQAKLAFRNESRFFKIKSALSGNELISQCSPECRFKIYEQEEWYSDKWDPMQYGRDFDPTKPFLEQLEQLNLDVPMPHASLTPDNENSNYIGNASNAKNCYLISNSTSPENCMYGVGFWHSRDCVDCYKVYNCENCYEVVIGYDCYSCFFSKNISNCSESYFLEACNSCRNCFGCINLNSKTFWAFNRRSSREEIEKLKNDFSSSKEKREEIILKVKKLFLSQPKRFSQVFACENSCGNYLRNCKGVQESFFVTEAENVKYCTNLSENSKDIYDCSFVGMNMEKVFQAVTVGLGVSNVISCAWVYADVRNIFYSVYCIHGCSDLFGCVGLRHKQYCILNKQYSKQEYEKKVAQVIEHMQKTGEWGEFIPISLSHYGYNDSLANFFYPMAQEDAIKIGANWTKGDYNIKFDSNYYKPEEISEYSPNKSDMKIQEALNGVLECKISGRPFKIIHSELAFYIKNKLPIPEIHPELRQSFRFKDCNGFKLWHRKCMNEDCQNEFDTTYSPDREEKVYCEKCYQQTII